MADSINLFEIDNDVLSLRANHVSWDSDVFGMPVAAITTLVIKNHAAVQAHFDLFKDWVCRHAFGIVSCRLPHQQIDASMLLEKNGFHFIEMTLHPLIAALQFYPVMDTGMVVNEVCEAELPSVINMAQRAFGVERYHIDPRIDRTFANIRYGRWVANCFRDTKQVLLKVVMDGRLVGFFVVENKDDRSVYWHLTAVNPDFQGQGLGHLVWLSMIAYHKAAGMANIRTTISARNTPVLNLYSKLNFRFDPPEMTFHWVKS